MSEYAQKTAQMVNMLPPDEQAFAFEVVKRMVKAWDPDFTKLTPAEAAALKEAESDPAYFTLDEIMQELQS